MNSKTNKPSQSKRTRHIVIIVVSAMVIASVLATQTGLVGLAEGLLPRASAQDKQPPEPLTDVAPPQLEVDVQASEHPDERFKAMGLDKLPSDPGPLPWDVMDVRNPPQWTKTLAEPSGAPVAPNPFKAPPTVVNPERGQPDDAPPLWAIQLPKIEQSESGK